jgi:hypothetical protein
VVLRDQIEAIEQRDRALVKLSDLTQACLFVATALLAAFSVIAAVTIPGQSEITATTSTAEAAPSAQRLEGVPSGSVHRGAGLPVAVSGGSR